MTAISTLYNKIMISMPIFTILYYILSWVHVGMFGVFLIYASIIKIDKYSKRLDVFGVQNDQEQDDGEILMEDMKQFIEKGKE